MKLTVYRQASKIRPDGTVVYKGEDALPYIDNQLFMVADGMGGAAAMYHQKFNRDMFDKEKIMDVLFSGTFENYDDPDFVKYVIDSFFEFFAVKDCYTDNIYNMKKGGYFASRIITSIVLHEFLYNKEKSAENILKKLGSIGNEIELNNELKALSDYFNERIKTDLRSIAKNANFVYESAMSGLALLGTTLCATLYYETENYVDALYLTAGDSRPYVWTRERGLCQLLLDEEDVSGGMTNYIKANEDTDFTIRCNYFRFSKPCVLFNSSDGCFDSGKFISQLAFEKLILDYAKSAESEEKLSVALEEFFAEYGRHDDSSTIAMKFFGYDSFSAFKADADERLAVLEKDYISVMPDILDVDYIAEYEQSADMLPGKMSELKGKLETEKGIVNYCTEYVRSGKYKPYTEQIHAIDNEIEAQKDKIKDAEDNIENIIAKNFVKFKPLLGQKESWTDKRYMSKIQIVADKYRDYASEYLCMIDEHKKDFEEAAQLINALFDRILEIGVPEGFEDFDDISFQIAENCEKTINSMFKFLAGLKSGKLDTVKKISQLSSDYVEKNIKLAQSCCEDVCALRYMIVEGRISLEKAEMISDDKKKISAELEVIKAARAEIERLGSEAKKEAIIKSLNSYWEENYIEIISAVVRDGGAEISDAVRHEAVSVLNELSEQTDGLKEKCELQKQLFAKYDKVYSMYIGGDTQ